MTSFYRDQHEQLFRELDFKLMAIKECVKIVHKLLEECEDVMSIQHQTVDRYDYFKVRRNEKRERGLYNEESRQYKKVLKQIKKERK